MTNTVTAAQATRVHLKGHPELTGTVVKGDEYSDRVTVKFDEGRTLRLSVRRLTWPLPRTYWLTRNERGDVTSVEAMHDDQASAREAILARIPTWNEDADTELF
jgi:hypothetical protein